MFLVYGKRTARIKKFTYSQYACPNCHEFDLDVKVYRTYYHFFFIPVFPVGEKTVTLTCRRCGSAVRSDSLQQQFEKTSKTPFYLYATPLLFAGLFAIALIGNLNTQKEKARLVEHPQVGDVYRMRRDENNSTTYYFLRLAAINGDTVIAYRNNLVYSGFITKLNEEDYFRKDDKLFLLRSDLKRMLDKMEINAVERDYGEKAGFNRVR